MFFFSFSQRAWVFDNYSVIYQSVEKQWGNASPLSNGVLRLSHKRCLLKHDKDLQNSYLRSIHNFYLIDSMIYWQTNYSNFISVALDWWIFIRHSYWDLRKLVHCIETPVTESVYLWYGLRWIPVTRSSIAEGETNNREEERTERWNKTISLCVNRILDVGLSRGSPTPRFYLVAEEISFAASTLLFSAASTFPFLLHVRPRDRSSVLVNFFKKIPLPRSTYRIKFATRRY